jgi:hypothetical protein
MLIRALRFERVYGNVVDMPPFRRKKRDIHTYIHTHIRTNITRKALKFGAIMEKTPNSRAPTLKLVNGPAGRDYGTLKGYEPLFILRISGSCALRVRSIREGSGSLSG